MKRVQLWLTLSEAELLRDSLDFWAARLNDSTVLSDAHKAAGRNVYRRIAELNKRLAAIIKSLSEHEA